MTSKITFEDTPQAKPVSDEHLTQQLAHIKKWLFVISGMVAMIWLEAVSGIVFIYSRTPPVLPLVWFLLMVGTLGLGIVLWKWPRWNQLSLRVRHEFIVWSLTLSWLTTSAYVYYVLSKDDPIAVLLIVLPTGFGLWSFGRWLQKKAFFTESDESSDTLFP